MARARAPTYRLNSLCKTIKNSFCPADMEQEARAEVMRHIWQEISTTLSTPPDYLFVYCQNEGAQQALMAVAEELPVKICAVSSKNYSSAASVNERKLSQNLYETLVLDDREAAMGCHQLLRREALLGGPGTGAVVSALVHMAPHLEPQAYCVLICPDRGERFIDTIFNHSWLKQNLGLSEADLHAPMHEPRTSFMKQI